LSKNEPPWVRTSSSTLGKRSESMMWPWISTSSTAWSLAGSLFVPFIAHPPCSVWRGDRATIQSESGLTRCGDKVNGRQGKNRNRIHISTFSRGQRVTLSPLHPVTPSFFQLSGAKHFAEHFSGVLGEAAFLNSSDGGFHGVLVAFEFNAPVLHDGVARA